MQGLNRKNLIYIFSFISILILTGIIYCATLLSRETFYNGISVEGISLKGLSKDEALNKVREYSKNINLDQTIAFSGNGNAYKYSINDIGLTYLAEKTVEEVYNIGREGSVFRRLLEIRSVHKNNRDFTLEYSYNAEYLKEAFNKLQTQINVEEKGAKLFYKAGKYTVLKEVVGKRLNIEKSIEAFEDSISKRDFNSIPLVIEDIYPAATAEKISDIKTVISTSTTNFNAGDVNRSFNIKYGCQKLDGTVLMPGEVFSMNTALGPRTIENGYRDAKVILQDELVDGPGGGVCQLTTTLYGAVLKSMLSVTERMHHSFPLGYVPPGQDATIAENYIDFKFANNKDYPVVINAETNGGTLTVRILGFNEQNCNVKLKSEIIEVKNPEPAEIIKDKSLLAGESIVVREEKQGKRVQVIREVYDKSGTLIEKSKISDDIYRPIRGLIRMN